MTSMASASADSVRNQARQLQQQSQPQPQPQPRASQPLIQQHQPFPSSTSSYSIRHSASSSSLFDPNDSVKIAFHAGSNAGSNNNLRPFQYQAPYQGQSSSNFERTPLTSSSSTRRPAFRSQSVVVESSATLNSSHSISSSSYGAGGTGTRHGTISGAIPTLTVPGGGNGGGRHGPFGGFSNGFTNGRASGNGSTARGSSRRPRASTVQDALLRDSNSDLNSLYTIDNTTSSREHGDDEDDDEGGASYFGSSGQDFMLKKKRAKMSRWLCWIDLLFLIIFTVLTGLQFPEDAGTSTDWTWTWKLVPIPLTAMAIVRILIIGFTVRYSHGNYNAAVIFVCLLFTIFIMFEVNMMIQHRISISPILMAQYVVSLLLTQLHWISYSAHTPMSATLSYAYDPILAESITFSRESRYIGVYPPHGRGSALRSGNSYGTMTNSPFDAVQELDEGEEDADDEQEGRGNKDRDRDAFIKVNLNGEYSSRQLARSSLLGRRQQQPIGSDEDEDRNDGEYGTRRRHERNHRDNVQEEDEEEQDMATLLAFQDARRQQVYAFSPTASSSVMPEHSILSPPSGSAPRDPNDLLGKSPLSWAFRGLDPSGTAGGGGSVGSGSGGLTVGYTPRRRRPRPNMDPNGSGRRTWTGGHSIIYSGILVESSDDDEVGAGLEDDAVEIPSFEIEDGALQVESSHPDLLEDDIPGQQFRQPEGDTEGQQPVDDTIKTEVQEDGELKDRSKSLHHHHHNQYHHRNGTETTIKDGTDGHGHESGPRDTEYSHEEEGELETADDRPRPQKHPKFRESSTETKTDGEDAVVNDATGDEDDNPGAVSVEVIHEDHHHLSSSHGLSTLKLNVASRTSITAILCEEENCEEHPFQEGPASELEAILGKRFKGGNIIELDIHESSSSSMDRAGNGINPEFEDDDDDENGKKSTGQPTKVQRGAVKQHEEPRLNTLLRTTPVFQENGESPYHLDRPHGSTGIHKSGRIEQAGVEEDDVNISDPVRKHFPGSLAANNEDAEDEEGGYRRIHVRERIEKVTITEDEYNDIGRRGGVHQHGGVGVGVGLIEGGTIVAEPSMIVPGQWIDIDESERGVITWGIVDDIPEGFVDPTLVVTGPGPEPMLVIPPQRTEIVAPPRATTPVIVYRPQPRAVLIEPPPPPPESEPVIVIPPPRPQPQYQPQPRVLVRPPAEPIYVQPPPPPPVIIQQRPPPPPAPVYKPPPRIIPPPPPTVFVPEAQVIVAPEPTTTLLEPAPVVVPVAEYGTYETIVPGTVQGTGAYGGVSAYQGGSYGAGAYGGISAYQGGSYGAGAYGGVSAYQGGPYGDALGGGIFPGGVGNVPALNSGDVASIYENEQGYDVASVYDDRSVASIHELENGPGILGVGAIVDPYGYDGYDGYGGIPGRRGPVIAAAGELGYGQHLVSAAHVARSDSDLRVHRHHSAEDDMALTSAAFINGRRLGREEPQEQYGEQTWPKRNPQQYQELDQGGTLSTNDNLDDMVVAGNQHVAFPSDSANTEVSYHEVQLDESPAVMQELAIETYFDTTKSQLKMRKQQGQLLSEMASQLKRRQQQQEQENLLQQNDQSLRPLTPSEYEEVQAHSISASSQHALRSSSPGVSSLSQQLQQQQMQQQQSPPTLNIPKPPSNPPPVRLLANRGVPTPLVNASRGSPIALVTRKTFTTSNIGESEISSRNIVSENNIEEGVPGEEENGSEPILSTSALASENIMMQLRNQNSPNYSEGPAKLTTPPVISSLDGAGSAVSRARALILGSNLTGASTLSAGKGISTATVFAGLAETRPNQSLKHAFRDQGARATAAALASKRRRRGERVAAMSRSHLHPIMLTEGIMACWNNEFAYALDVFKENSASFPRWSLATAEVHIVRQLISGQLSEPDSELMESLQHSEQVASRILDKKQEFESSYMSYRSICSADASLISVNENTLRQNYKWDCEMSFYDALLYRGILQLTGSSDTKGTFSDIRGGLQLRRAWKGYMRIKQEIEQAKDRWQKLSTLCAQAQAQVQADADSDMASPTAVDDKENIPVGTQTFPAPVSIPSSLPKRSVTSAGSSSHPVEGSRWSIFGRRTSTHHSSTSFSTSPVDGAELPLSSSSISNSNEPRTRSKFLASSPSSKGLASVLREQSKALDEIKTAVKVLDDIEDYVRYGLGLFYFIVTIVPKSLLPALRTIGLQSNHEQGIQHLESVFAHKNGRAPFSALFLLINYLFLPRGMNDPNISLGRAGDILQDCLKSCPNGSSYLLMACHHARKSGNIIPGALNHITRGIQTCEAAGIPSINYRFELGLTFFVNQEFEKAADIFEILWRRFFVPITANSSVAQAAAARRRRTSRSNSINQSLSTSTVAQDMSVDMDDEEEDDFELAPFCGLCLIACKVVIRLGQEGYFEYGREGFGHHLERATIPGGVLGSDSGSTTPSTAPRARTSSDSDLLVAAQEVLAMMATPEQLNTTTKTTLGGSIFEHVKTGSTQSSSTVQESESSFSHGTITGSGFIASFSPPPPPSQAGKLNRFNKFAWNQCQKSLQNGRISPFLPLVILYLRRDLAYMKPVLLRKFKTLLETIWKSVQSTADGDSQAIYLLLSAVVHRQLLPDDATFAYTSLTDCLLLESTIVSEMWVIPYCHYELGELLFKKLHLPQAALEQFKWVVKGPGKEARPASIFLSGTSSNNNSSSSLSHLNSNPRLSVFGGGYPSDTITNLVESAASPLAAAAFNRHSQIFSAPACIPPSSSSSSSTSGSAASGQSPPSPASFYSSRYKKFEFSQVLRQRSSICIEQIQKTILEEARNTAAASETEGIDSNSASSTMKSSKSSRGASEPVSTSSGSSGSSAVAAAVQATPSYQGWSSTSSTLPNILSDAQRRRGSQQWMTGSQVSLKATLSGKP